MSPMYKNLLQDYTPLYDKKEQNLQQLKQLQSYHPNSSVQPANQAHWKY